MSVRQISNSIFPWKLPRRQTRKLWRIRESKKLPELSTKIFTKLKLEKIFRGGDFFEIFVGRSFADTNSETSRNFSEQRFIVGEKFISTNFEKLQKDFTSGKLSETGKVYSHTNLSWVKIFEVGNFHAKINLKLPIAKLSSVGNSKLWNFREPNFLRRPNLKLSVTESFYSQTTFETSEIFLRTRFSRMKIFVRNKLEISADRKLSHARNFQMQTNSEIFVGINSKTLLVRILKLLKMFVSAKFLKQSLELSRVINYSGLKLFTDKMFT